MLDSIPARVPAASLAPPSADLRYLFIDFNAYFASVEQHDEPAIRGRPVIVTPLKSDHSGAIAASYEAKALGISRGTSVVDARRICPDVIVRPARHDRYVAVHLKLMEEIERHLPIAQIMSIDECACRLDRTECDEASALAKARAIKRGIYSNVGESLRCSIGVASSALLAKLAGELQKPDGLTALPMSILPGALADLPLRAIPGIGAGVENRLRGAGVNHFLDLWNLAPRHARQIWGSVQGERFLYALRGHDVSLVPAPAEKRMIGHSRVLGGADRQPDRARIVARALLLKAASRLRRYGLHAAGMHVGVKLYPEGALSHDAPLRPTQNSWQFLRQLDAFWDPMMAALQRKRPGATLKHVSVYLFNLQPGPPDRDLFVPAEADNTDARQAALWDRIDKLNQRYGKAKLMLASQAGLDLNYLGVKIAFSRVPDKEEFADMGAFTGDQASTFSRKG